MKDCERESGSSVLVCDAGDGDGGGGDDDDGGGGGGGVM